MAYSKTASSVIQGMSQQADKYKVDGQCRYQKNLIPSPIDGVCKRPSTDLVAVLDFLDITKEYKWFNVEISGFNYQFILGQDNLYIVENFVLIETIPVTGDLHAYIEEDLSAIKMFYIKDRVYILNTNKEVKTQTEDAISHAVSCAFWAVGASTNKEYTVTINVHQLSDDSIVYTDTQAVTVSTPENTTTSYIIDTLFGGLSGSTWFDLGKTHEVVCAKLKTDFQTTHYMSIITDDDASNTYLKSYSEVVRNINDLPRMAYSGMRATLSVAEGNIDDWYVKFDPDDQVSISVGEDVTVSGLDTGTPSAGDYNTTLYIDTDSTMVFNLNNLNFSRHIINTEITAVQSNLYDLTWENVPGQPALNGTPVLDGQIVPANETLGSWSTIRATRKTEPVVPRKGIWKEVAKPGNNNFETTTLPAVLNRIEGDWVLEQKAWLPRRVGDEDSAPFPKFVDKTINSMYEHAGRLIIVTDDSVDLGTVGEHSNWFRNSATDILITDPFSVSYGQKKGNLRFPVTLNGDLFVFGDKDQLKLSGAPLSPTNYSLNGVSSYPVYNIPPVVTGDLIHFISKSDRYNTVYAFAPKSNTSNVMSAESISDQISRSIQGNVEEMVSDYNLNSMLIRTTLSNNKLFLYNFYFVDEELKQSAWSEVEFNFEVINVFVADNAYYLVGINNGTYNVYKFDIKDVARDENIYLDIRQELTFNNGVASVEILDTEFKLYDWQDRPGTELPYVDNGDGTITCSFLEDEVDYKCYIGKTFEIAYTPSLVTEQTATGRINHTANIKLSAVGLDLGVSGQFKVTVKGNGADYDNNYNLSNLPKEFVGYQNAHKYVQEVSVRALCDDHLVITILAENPEPFVLEGLYFLYRRSQRRTAI